MIVKTPSRLHFGIIDLSREFERQYGAFGVMIKGGYKMKFELSEELSVHGTEKEKKRAESIYDTLKDEFGFQKAFQIEVKERIPRHMGLGSTTQLTLGLAAGMTRMIGEKIASTELADLTGRGRYSAIGTHGFDHGGFILEGGKRGDEIPPLTARYDIPENWRFLMVRPNVDKAYDEEEERPIMDEKKVEKKYPEKICHHLVMGVLPAVKTGDLDNFSLHLSRIQHLVGRSFSNYQGGEFHPAVGGIVDKLEEITKGAGQSSWGPTVYGLTTAEVVEEKKKEIEEWLGEKGKDAEDQVGLPDNDGAELID